MSGAFDVEVRALMRAGVVTLGAESTIEQARRAMLAHQVHALLVIGPAGRPLGWITAAAVLDHVQRAAQMTTVGAAVDEPAVRVHPSDPATRAVEMLTEHGVHRLYVARTDDDHPEGVIGEFDLLSA
jgi:CBS domain-containing protein